MPDDKDFTLYDSSGTPHKFYINGGYVNEVNLNGTFMSGGITTTPLDLFMSGNWYK